MKINIIYNVTSDGIIGINNDLFIKSKKDLQYFKNITTDEYNNNINVVIMGYNTWRSIDKKPLKNRINIVITNHHYNEIENESKTLSEELGDNGFM